MCKIFKRRAKCSLLGHFSAPGLTWPTRKLRYEVTSSPGRASYFRRKEATRPGELLCSLHPLFLISTHEEGWRKGPTSEINKIWEKLVRRRRKKKKNQGQGASVMFPWSILWSFFVCSSSFFDRLVSIFWSCEFILCTLRGPSLLFMSSFSFFYHRWSFSLF